MLESAKNVVTNIKLFYIIAMCFWVIDIVMFIISVSSVIMTILSDISVIFSLLTILFLGTFGIISGIQVDGYFYNYVINKNTSLHLEARKNLIINFIESNIFVILLAITIMKWNKEILTTLIFPIIPCLIGHILYIILICLILKEEKQSAKDLDRTKNLLEKVGSKFFVKYYNQLKSNSVVDIIDIIEEDYSEETKKKRILSAKKIFAENLQNLALQEILNDKNTILDDNLLRTANELLVEEISNTPINETSDDMINNIEEETN